MGVEGSTTVDYNINTHRNYILTDLDIIDEDRMKTYNGGVAQAADAHARHSSRHLVRRLRYVVG